MRIYTTLLPAVKETERELIEMGCLVHPETMQDKDVRDNQEFDTKELQGYGYIITTHVDFEEDLKRLGIDITYARIEFDERIKPTWINPGTAYLKRRNVWADFIEKNGKFSYTYNERIREQLERIIQELTINPNTRQAIITIYDRHQDISNIGGIRRVPCSMYYQMLRRKRKEVEVIDLIYTMRSCDFYTHFLYDVYFAMRMQEYIANSVGLEPGNFTHFIGSLHAYKKDWESKEVF